MAFGKREILNSVKRILLMRKIVSHFIENGQKMGLDICEQISEQIPKYFVGETKVKRFKK